MAPAAEYSNIELDRALRASVLSRQQELVSKFRRDGMYDGGRRYEERGVLEEDDIEDDYSNNFLNNEVGANKVGANEVGANEEAGLMANNEEEDDDAFINALTYNMN